ncbi:MAG: hypothetical protein MUC51_19980 [Anaerolineae bacterium]|nr:hypothetical protein [Anaerolineae bacterium]
MNAATISKGLSLLLMAWILTSSGAVRAEPGANQWATDAISCGMPRDAEEAEQCAGWERRILDATVYLRLRLRCGEQSDLPESEVVISHATILDNETLLTHDHYDILVDPDCQTVALQATSANGLYFATNDHALLEDLAVQLRSEPDDTHYQARLVRFPTPLFTPSAALTFETFTSLPSRRTLSNWGELAEVNWDKSLGTTRVQWTHPLHAGTQGSALGLVLEKPVGFGASGGGVFRITPDGVTHVGNIWGTWQEDGTSIVALNPAAFER